MAGIVAPCSASAPNKVIIAGEHSVVWGGRALAAPIEVDGKRNTVTAKFFEGGKGIFFKGDLGIARLEGGKKTGTENYFPYLDAIAHAAQKNDFDPGKKAVRVELGFSGAPKGTGNSASIAAATIASVFGLFLKKLTAEELFAFVMPAENAFHGGKASGIDPRAVCSGSPFEFWKTFGAEGKETFHFEEKKLAAPDGCVMVLVDTYQSGKRESTGDLVNRFGKSHGLYKKPGEIPAGERKKAYGKFDAIVEKISNEMGAGGNAKKIGKLFNENQKLLREGGVSSESIDKAIGICGENGSLGAKLSGAGGNGGAVIALCEKEDLKRIERAVKGAGMAAYAVVFSRRGASLDG